MLKPKIRFSDFTTEWQPLSLGEVTHFKRGYDLPSSQRFDGEFPIISSSGYSGHHSEYKVSGPGLVTGRYGSIGEIYLVKEPHWPLNTALYVDNLFDNNINYCYFLLQTIDFKKFSDKTGVPGVNRNDLHKIKTAIPSTQEQQKIADFLTSVDTKISQLTEKHRLLKEYKKGVMQQIFSQKIRFKDKDGQAFPDWKIEAIGKYLEPYKELVSASTDLPILTSSRTGLYLQERSVINEGEYGVVPLGYFTYRHMSDDLVFKFNVNRICERGAVSKEYPVFKTINMDTYFLESRLNEGDEFKRFAIQQKQGGTRTRLYFKNLKELKLALPCLEEQQKIAKFLESLDSKINTVAEQIEQTKQFKKGLLQQMFV